MTTTKTKSEAAPKRPRKILNNYPPAERAVMFKAGMIPALSVARKLGVTATSVYHWLREGKVEGEVMGGFRRYVNLVSLRAHVGERMWFACEFDKITAADKV